jgi:hypothetical protein
MQPLLLLKQTLEAPYDPGALLLDGPNVRFTSFEQMLFRAAKSSSDQGFTIGLDIANLNSFTIRFRRQRGQQIDVDSMTSKLRGRVIALKPGVTDYDPSAWPSIPANFIDVWRQKGYKLVTRVTRQRCFLERDVVQVNDAGDEVRLPVSHSLATIFEPLIVDVIHLPGLRGNPKRTYPVSAVGPRFTGTFENYVASIISKAATDGPVDFLDQISSDLRELGLTWKVTASAIDDTQVELRVGRLPQPGRGGAHDLVNIADVGFGVSQTLPVVVALQVARPGQLVYIEQPELHLHPRAQVAMARLLANAANRGVRVVAETHSSLLLVGVQSLVAESVLAPDKVKLHWFQRNPKDGSTDIASADLDQSGAYGDWPEDFLDVELEADHRYTRAAHDQLRNVSHGQGSPAAAGD